MKKLCFSFLAIFAALVLTTSCRGRDGRDGNDGRDANVASSTLTVNSNDWRWDNNTSWRVDIDYDNITPNIIDYGAVLVYMENQNTWRQLPMTFYYSLNGTDGVEYRSSSLEVSSYDKGLSIFWTESDFSSQYRPETCRFKIVVIEASIYAARSDVDFSDYDAVRKAFDITTDNNIELIK